MRRQPALDVLCIVALCIVLQSTVGAREVHVAVGGNDENPGTADAPWRTIQKAATIVGPGDMCIVHEGTYRETVRPLQSGTSGRPIRFVTAEDEDVVLTGTEAITDWSAHRGSIRRVHVDWPVEQVFVDGRRMVPARTPNAGATPFDLNFAKITVESGRYRIEGLDAPKDIFKGGILWAMHHRAWVASTVAVTESEGDNVTTASRGPIRDGEHGSGCLTGVLGALDAEREWHQHGDTLYLWAPPGNDPKRQLVEVTKRRWAFDLAGRAHIEVHGFRLQAAGINMDEAEYCVIDGIRARCVSFQRVMKGGFNRDRGIGPESEGLGIVLGGHDNTIRNSVVAYCVGDGISIYGEDNTVENCVVHDCNSSASDCAPINCTGTGHAIVGCTLFNGGRSLLVHRKLRKGLIEHNHLYNAGLITNDLGATYTFQTDGEGTVIAYNRVHDVHCHTGVGIYVDNMSPNHIVHHNLCTDCDDCGIRLNTPTRHVLIYHNTLTGNGRSIAWWGSNNNGAQPECVVAGNIMTDSVDLGDGAVARDNFLRPDPGFLDADGDDYRLAPGSPCIDAGTTIPGITAGHDGKAPDLGCYEHGRDPGTAGSTIPRDQWDETGW